MPTMSAFNNRLKIFYFIILIAFMLLSCTRSYELILTKDIDYYKQANLTIFKSLKLNGTQTLVKLTYLNTLENKDNLSLDYDKYQIFLLSVFRKVNIESVELHRWMLKQKAAIDIKEVKLKKPFSFNDDLVSKQFLVFFKQQKLSPQQLVVQYQQDKNYNISFDFSKAFKK